MSQAIRVNAHRNTALALATFSLTISAIMLLFIKTLPPGSFLNPSISTGFFLAISTSSLTLFVLSCFWALREHRTHKAALKLSETAISVSETPGPPGIVPISLRRPEGGGSIAAPHLVLSPLSLGGSDASATVVPTSSSPSSHSEPSRISAPLLSEADRSLFIQDQLARLPPLISNLMDSVENFLCALWEKYNKRNIPASERAIIRRAASDLRNLLPPIEKSDLETFYQLKSYPLPIPLAGRDDINRLRSLARVERNAEALEKLSTCEAQVIEKIRMINMCACSLEYIDDLLYIGTILERAGDTTNAEAIAAVRGRRLALLDIIAKIPRENERSIREQLIAFNATLPDPTTLKDRWQLHSKRLKSLANKCPKGSKEALLVSYYVDILEQDIRKKKSIAKGCFDKISDNIDDLRALNPAFAKVTPFLTIEQSHKHIFNILSKRVLPAIESILQKEEIEDIYNVFIRVHLEMQSLFVMSSENLRAESPQSSVFTKAQYYSSVGTPIIGGGDRKPLSERVKELRIAPWWVLARFLSHDFVKSKIFTEAPEIIEVILHTLFDVIRPGTELRKAVLPKLLSGLAKLYLQLQAESEKPFLNIADLLSLFITHFNELSSAIKRS